jgi:hypothetical protein
MYLIKGCRNSIATIEYRNRVVCWQLKGEQLLSVEKFQRAFAKLAGKLIGLGQEGTIPCHSWR